jgi:hypothetical protein
MLFIYILNQNIRTNCKYISIKQENVFVHYDWLMMV